MADTTQQLTPTGLPTMTSGADPGFSAPLDPNDPAAIGGAAMRTTKLLSTEGSLEKFHEALRSFSDRGAGVAKPYSGSLSPADQEAQAAKAAMTINLPSGPLTIDGATGTAVPGGTPMASVGTPKLPDVVATANAGTTADALSKLIEGFEVENRATQDKILAASVASEREQALQKQIDDLGAQVQKGLLNIEGRPIPIEDIGGEQERLLKNAAVLLNPLTNELKRTESSRMGTLDRLSRALGFRRDDQEMQIKRAEMLRKPILDAEASVRDYVLDLARKYPDAEIDLADTAESAAKKVAGSKLYQQETAGKLETQVIEVGGRKVLINSQTGDVIKALGASGSGGDGSLGTVTFGATTGPSTTETTPQNFEAFLAAEQEKAGQSFGQKKRDELKKQFEAQQKTSNGDIKQNWLNNPGVDSRIKDIISGRSKFTDYTQTERKQLQAQYNQASNDGVVPQSTTAAQDAKFTKLTAKYDQNPIIRQADKAAGLNIVADQVISNPGSATNQLKALYSLVKQLDPDSAVREGELSLAQETLSTIDKYGLKITKLKTGQILPPEQAVQFAKAIKELGTAWNSSLSRVNTRFAAEAKVSGIDQMWGDYVSGFEVAAPVQSAPKTGTTNGGRSYTVTYN